MTEAKRNGWGGARPGAGRPPRIPGEKRETKGFRLAPSALVKLEARAALEGVTVSEALNRCVLEWDADAALREA